MNADDIARLKAHLGRSARCSPPATGRLELSFPADPSIDDLVAERGGVQANRRWHFESVNALDLLGLVFENARDGGEEADDLFAAWSAWRLHDGRLTGSLRVTRLRPDAVLPSKSRVSDSGYDLTLIHLDRRIGQVALYGTGLVVTPPEGWYFDVIARSSIIKTGHMLANCVGVIDRAYRGELFVPVIKVDSTARDLELPVRLAQLIPRPVVHFPVIPADDASTTSRGAGGFGSTGR